VGRTTNLLPGSRQDVYQAVADKLALEVSTLALSGDGLASMWAGNVTRKTIKTPLMASGYGITDVGTREALMEHAAKVSAKDAYRLAKWLTFRLKETMKGGMAGPTMVMKYLQETAHMIATAERPISWIAPSGSRVTQAYSHYLEKRVETLLGKLSIRNPAPVETLPDIGKAASSLPANVVHSLDASHLVAVVTAFGRDVVGIHDCVGAHASDVGELHQIIRVEFHRQYNGDLMAEFAEQQRQQHPDLVLPKPPQRGTLDISGVLESPYLFS
jgi:DNA-directed RNA polymerase